MFVTVQPISAAMVCALAPARIRFHTRSTFLVVQAFPVMV